MTPVRGLEPSTPSPGDAVLENRLSPRVQPTAGAQPAPPAPDQMAGQPDGTQAPPEMQQAYEQFVGRASMILWSEPVRNAMRDKLKTTKDPVSTIAEFSAQVGMKAIKDSAKEGTMIPPAVAVHGGQEIVQQAGEIAEKAGRPLKPQELETAYYLAMDRGRAVAQKEGLLDQDAMAQDAQQLEAMKSDGRMEQVWNAIRQANAQGQDRPALPQPKGV